MNSNPKMANSMNPYTSRGTVGIISRAVMSFSGKDILLVEGKTDKKTYKIIVDTLGKTNIYVLPVYEKGRYLSSRDVKRLGKPNDVSPKRSIILLVKRCFAREWAKGCLFNRFYGIVDKDFFFDGDMEIVNHSLLDNPGSMSMSEEEGKALLYNPVNNGRLVTTDTNDVESLIFKFDYDAVKKTCKFAASTNNLDDLKAKALEMACKKGIKEYKTEANWYISKKYIKQMAQPPLSGIDWKYCKGHFLVRSFLNLLDKNKKHFKNEEKFINSVINNLTVANFTNSEVYKFIDSIEPNPDWNLNTIYF